MKKDEEKNKGFLFNKDNYTIMIVGLVMISLGFYLMAGGQSTDPNIFPKEEVYSFTRITLAPIIVILGFIIETYAIFHKSKK
jgi:hypothetical protein